MVFLIFLAGRAALPDTGFWNYLNSYESTDDAADRWRHLRHHQPDRRAPSKRFTSRTISRSKPGQLLVELDPSDYEVALEQAKAALNESQTRSRWPGRTCRSPPFRRRPLFRPSVNRHRRGAGRASPAAQRDYESAVADVRKCRSGQRQSPGRSRALQAYWSRKTKSASSNTIRRRRRRNRRRPNVDAKKATAEAAARNIEEAQARLEQSQTQTDRGASATVRSRSPSRMRPSQSRQATRRSPANAGRSGAAESFLHENLRAGRRRHRQEERRARASRFRRASS